MRLLANGQSQAASARLDRARQERPDDPAPPTVLGTALSMIGQREEAITAFNRALEFDPVFAPALYFRGVEKQTVGDLSGATEDFEKAADAAPHYAEPLAQLADV